MAITGQVTGFGTGTDTANGTGQALGGLVGEWWDLERQALALARQAVQQGGFTITGIPRSPSRLFFTGGAPINAVQRQLAAVISEANALYQRILEAGDVSVSGNMGGGFSLGSILGGIGGGGAQGLPPLQNQADDALGMTRNLTLADQLAGGKPFDGVPKPLKRQIKKRRL